MSALFGPGGNSESFYAEGNKHTLQAPAWLKKLGLDAYEYQAGNGIDALGTDRAVSVLLDGFDICKKLWCV